MKDCAKCEIGRNNEIAFECLLIVNQRDYYEERHPYFL